jgi:hypothetical protein
MTWLRQLFGAMSNDEMAGISLAVAQWEVQPSGDTASAFFAALPLLVPDTSLLFLEGGSHPSGLRRYLETHAIHPPRRPALGTLWPRHSFFTLPASPDVLTTLVRLTQTLPYPEVCDHLHVFLGEEVLLEGHDAFSQPFLVSRSVPEAKVEQFCAKLGWQWQAVGQRNG